MPVTRIFITGCARSGTTLLNRLFYAFRDVDIVDHEISIDDFCGTASHKRFLVGKRTPCTILSVPLPEEELQRQLALVSSHRIRIVNMIRDGRDVVHQNPTGPQCNVNRWIGCVLQAQRFCGSVSLEVRYEDLVGEPDTVQSQLAASLGLCPAARFQDYPAFVPGQAFEEPEYREFPYYSRRPIDGSSIGHSPTEYVALCTSREEQELFERVLSRLGYFGGKEAADQWSPHVLARERELFMALSRKLGYHCG